MHMNSASPLLVFQSVLKFPNLIYELTTESTIIINVFIYIFIVIVLSAVNLQMIKNARHVY